MAPVETLRDESSLMIIEEEEEAKSKERETKGNEIVAKVCLISKYYCENLLSPKSLLEKTT